MHDSLNRMVLGVMGDFTHIALRSKTPGRRTSQCCIIVLTTLD